MNGISTSIGKAWLAAFWVAAPIAQILVFITVVSAFLSGDIGVAIVWLLFGWIAAAIAGIVIAIPLGLIFMGVALTWSVGALWWRSLPFTISRKG